MIHGKAPIFTFYGAEAGSAVVTPGGILAPGRRRREIRAAPRFLTTWSAGPRV